MSEHNDTRFGGIIGYPFLVELVRNAPIPIAVLEGAELRFVLVNPAYQAIEDRPESFFLGRPIAEVFPEPELHGVVDAVRKAFETGEQTSQKEQECFLHPTGRQACWDIVNVPLHNAAGQVEAVLTIPEDVTEQVLVRRRIEEQAATLRMSEERLKLALEAADAGMWEWDMATGVMVGSDRALAMHGLPPGSQLTCADRLAAIHPDDREAVQAALEESVSQETPYEVEFRSLWPDGSVHWLASKGRLFGTRLLGLIQDITERKQVEEWLSQLATVVKGSSDFIGIAGLDQHALYVNPAGQAMVGLDGDEAVRTTKVEDYLFPEDLPFVRETALPTVMRVGRWKSEFRFRHFQTGEPIAVDWEIFRVDDPRTGRPVKLATVTRDIRPQKAAAQALQESEEMLRLAEQAGDIGSFEWCVQTGRLRLSAECQAIYGFAPEAYDGAYEAWTSQLSPDGLRWLEKQIGEAFARHEVQFKDEFRVVLANGQERWLEGRIRIDYDAEGMPLRVCGVKVDVTERRQIEEALRESEATLRGFFDANAVYMSVLELDGDDIVYTVSNLRLAAFFGLPIEEFAGKHGRELRLPEEFIARWGALIRQCQETQRPISREYSVPYRGNQGWYHGTLSPLPPGASGRPRCALAAVDITDRKRAEDALRESEKRLKAFNDTLEQRVIERTAIAEQRAAQLRMLAAELSQAEEQERRRLAKVLHDHLQQLLVAARMKVVLLRRRTDEERLTPTLEQIDEVLNQAIAESRSLTVELSPPVLYDAGLAAGLEWLARQMEEKHGLRVIVDADPEAEPTDEGTRVFLFQAVRELLLNVVKHAQTDVAHVELLSLDGDRLQLVVADPGVGFDFSGLENRGMSGGFGLFSIRERLELLGGRLAVETGPQQGTRMTIEVSRGRPSATPHVIPTELNPAETQEGERTERLTRRERTRVVLADDHAIVRQGLAGLLRDQGTIEVVGEAADGRQAVEVTLATHPDVVLMDVTMPGLNGIEATRRILSSLPEVRVIGLSMHEEADMATAMRKAGAVAYLRKDTDTDVLMSAIQAEPLSRYEVST